MLVDADKAVLAIIANLHKEIGPDEVVEDAIRQTDLTDCAVPVCEDCGFPLIKRGLDRSGQDYWCPSAAIDSSHRRRQGGEMIDIRTLRIAISRIEERVAELDKFAKQSADAGDYSGANSSQKSAVDLHCAVDLIKGQHVCRHPGFSAFHGDVCERCAVEAALDAKEEKC